MVIFLFQFKGTKKNEKVMLKLMRAVLLQYYVLCLLPLQGYREEAEDRAGSDAVRRMLLLENNSHDTPLCC